MMPPPQGMSQFLEGMRPMPGVAQPQQQPQMTRTVTIRNDVNLKKNSLVLVRDEATPTRHHLEFTYDASTECRISVYFAAVESNQGGVVAFTPLKPTGAHPTVSSPKGLGQKFRSRADFVFDTADYAPEELRHDPTAGRVPIVICMEAGARRNPDSSKVQSQTTLVKLLGGEGGRPLTAQPIKQKIQFGATSYELQEIYGIEGRGGQATGDRDAGAAAGAADEAEGGVEDNGRECVICMTEPRDTTVLPCRHMCMCCDCARQLRVQSNKCPICRTSIASLLQITIDETKREGA